MTHKLTTGYVLQKFNDEGQCVEQEFIASDVDYEDENGEAVEAPENEIYHPFNMVQPNE